MSASKHLLRWKGRQSGPFAPEEIRARLQSCDIGLMHEVQVDGQWVTVERFLTLTAPRPAAQPAPRLEKKAPPPAPVERPREPAAPPPIPAAPLPVEPVFADDFDDESAEPARGETLAYGGFWLRVVANMIDAVILNALAWAIGAVALLLSGASGTPLPSWLLALVMALNAIGGWLYFALMESSEIQATLGKLSVGLIVADLDGERLTFSHATGRFFGKVISALTLGVGFFMAAFTGRKQALHDLIAGCLVLLRLPPTRIFQP